MFVVVHVIDEDCAEQYIDLIGAIFDKDTVCVDDAPFLVNVSDLDISFEDVKLPRKPVTGDPIVVFSGNVDVDKLLIKGAQI